MKIKFVLAELNHKEVKIGNLVFEIEYSVEELKAIVDGYKELIPMVLNALQAQDSMKWDDLPNLKAAA